MAGLGSLALQRGEELGQWEGGITGVLPGSAEGWRLGLAATMTFPQGIHIFLWQLGKVTQPGKPKERVTWPLPLGACHVMGKMGQTASKQR